MKKCSTCGQLKPRIEFYKNKRWNDGLSYICKECSKSYQKSTSGIKSKERARLKFEYGITPEQLDTMFANQGGKCYICATDNPGGKYNKFCVDHNHNTGTVRKLLCFSCNVKLGVIEDASFIHLATKYLQEHVNG